MIGMWLSNWKVNCVDPWLGLVRDADETYGFATIVYTNNQDPGDIKHAQCVQVKL